MPRIDRLKMSDRVCNLYAVTIQKVYEPENAEEKGDQPQLGHMQMITYQWCECLTRRNGPIGGDPIVVTGETKIRYAEHE